VSQDHIRLLVVIEAASVTGPVKNLLSFCQWTQSPQARAQGVNIRPTLATYVRSGASNAFIDAVGKLGLPLHLLPEKGRFDFSLLPALRQLATSVQPHILQTHNVKTNFLVKAAGLHKLYPWIAFQHGYTATDIKMLAYNQLDRWSLRSAQAVVTVCHAFTPKLLGFGVAPDRLSVLHNSVAPFQQPAPEECARLAASLQLDPQETILLTIGRFSREKAHADLLEALARLQNTRPQGWRAVLVGEGPEQARLQALTAQLKLQHRVLFAGFHSHINPWLALAGVFVLPSHSEGSPNVILEAMAAGLPIAATAAGGTPEIITHNQDALLSPVADPSALAANLDRLLTDSSLGPRLAARALTRASEHFSAAAYRRQLIEIYSNLPR